MLKLVISEKAIAGKNIASLLAGKDVPQSLLNGAPVFRFSIPDADYIVVPLRGHITDVEFPKKYSYWVGTDLRKLINAEIEYVGTEKSIIAALKQSAVGAQEVIIATDADREGESIGVEALNFIKQSNSGIKVKRAYFSAITKKDISDAFAKLVDVDYNFADSADSRREIDLIWGAVLTRFLSLVSGQLGKDYLSVGRVQTPALAILVNREKERLAFKTRKYWELLAVFEKNGKKFSAEHKKGKFWEKEEPARISAASHDYGIVKSIKSTERVLKKPTPFNTTDFLRQATAIGLSASQAMEIAERLYQQGYTSYPRTDNTVYSSTLDIVGILGEISKVPEFSRDAEALLSRKSLSPSKGKKETKDHPPIHPVSAVPKAKLSDRDWKVYELIVRRFLATLSDDAVTENQAVEISLDEEPFIAHGQKILESGWKEVYPYSEISEVILPSLEEGEKVKLESLDMPEKETQPPTRYSESTLIKLMEDMGIGTKSTRHTIIQKLFARKYLSGSKAIEPSKIAFAVVDSLEKHNVDAVKAEMTSLLEKEMDKISTGSRSKAEVVEESRKLLSTVLERMIQSKDSIGSELRVALRSDLIVGKCDVCDGNLRTLISRNRKRFLGCTNYPKCTNTYPLPQKGKIVPTGGLCAKCGTPMIRVFGQRYRFEMCVDPECETKAEWKAKAAAKAAAAENPAVKSSAAPVAVK
ncbi:MAG: DNA topoisomerase I [Candidatus Diapherotrites archaeon]|uniref:DNA topoisomerase 1 n=1 Tax=Candidatus Iainarchaeum sp. TaxID=3101447 RepID=A0A8T3YLK4_9ARCH|nr:DNA topoisomerase I [Candidatus Diapherotrites archaeon]